MRHHHGHPLTRAMGLRPDHWSTTLGIPPRDPKDLRTDTDQTFLINQTDSAYIHIIYVHIRLIQFLIIHLFRTPNQTMPTHYSLTQNMELCLISLPCHIDTNFFHVSCRTHVKLIISISWTISYIYHTHIILKRINHNSHTIPFIKVIQFIFLKVITIQAHNRHFKSRKTSRPATFLPIFSLRQQDLAQARRTLAQASFPLLGESLTFCTGTLRAFSLRRDSPRLSETSLAQKLHWVTWATIRGKDLGEPLLISPRRD